MMPGLSGFDVCRQLEAEPTTQSIPIVIVTGLADLDAKITELGEGTSEIQKIVISHEMLKEYAQIA